MEDFDKLKAQKDAIVARGLEQAIKKAKLDLLDELEKPCPCPRDKFSPAIPKRECSFCMLQIRKEVTK